MNETERIYRIIAAVALAGTVVAALTGGTSRAIGFLLGGCFSAANFWFWHRTVERIGGEHRTSTAVFGLRYFLFGLAGYAIFKYFEASFLAVLTGCFVAVIAVLLEIIFELIHGT